MSDASTPPDATPVPAPPVSTPDNVTTATVPLPPEAQPESAPEDDTRCYIVYVDADGVHRVPRDEYDAAAH